MKQTRMLGGLIMAGAAALAALLLSGLGGLGLWGRRKANASGLNGERSRPALR
jgi:hypothetical protein